SLAQHARLQPAQESRPVIAAEKNDGESVDLTRLNQRQRLEQLVESSESAREDNECHRVLDEHRLADEEVAEIDQRIDVGVGTLLERQLDVATDRAAATE